MGTSLRQCTFLVRPDGNVILKPPIRLSGLSSRCKVVLIALIRGANARSVLGLYWYAQAAWGHAKFA